jgi:ABC-2 type transport system ATP-binding protein
MLKVSNLKKTFGAIPAVKDVCFEVRKGEVLGFLGPNGAGKSTTMRMITGFLTPDSGSAEICGFDILKNPVEAKRHLGYLPENAPSYRGMTVEDFLSFIASVRGFSGSELKKRVDEVMERTSLLSARRQTIETLSKGYRQRACFAQAILHDPDILIMDEPTDGLDPNQKFAVRQMITEMAKEKAIIVSTHILEEVDAVCTRCVIIARGQIVGEGTPAELKARDPQQRLDAVFRNLTLEVQTGKENA